MIRVGIGGWSYAPWKGVFYPKGMRAADELAYAASKLTLIEINATYYRNQSRASYARWRDSTPQGFVFSVKASRFITNARKLDEVAESAQRFIDSGLDELGDKLGPIVWQLPPWKRFHPDKPEELEAFLALLPRTLGKRPLCHALEARHESFRDPAFVELARRHNVATVFADSDEYPSFADRTADFVYARLMRTHAEIATGYSADDLAAWSSRLQKWAKGEPPSELPSVTNTRGPKASGDMFVLFISGAKERAPAAAEALIALLPKK